MMIYRAGRMAGQAAGTGAFGGIFAFYFWLFAGGFFYLWPFVVLHGLTRQTVGIVWLILTLGLTLLVVAGVALGKTRR